MKLVHLLAAASVFVGVCEADRLENTYLPPARAFSSGGGSFLAAPAPSNQRHSQNGFHSPNGETSFNTRTRFGGQQAPDLKLNNNNNEFGRYNYETETNNGILAQDPSQMTSVQGSYSYTAPDGLVYSVSYSADENDFHPVGDLPTPDTIFNAPRFNAPNQAPPQQFSGPNEYFNSRSEGHETPNRMYLPPAPIPVNRY